MNSYIWRECVKYCNPVQIQTRNLYSLKLDIKHYLRIRYNAVHATAQTHRKSTFFAFSYCFFRTDLAALKATGEFYQYELRSFAITIFN